MQPPLSDPEPARPPTELPARRAIYVYALGDALRLSGMGSAPGVEEPISVHHVGKIGAVFREVDAAEFSGSDAERNLADPAWIMRRIGQHEAVVENAMQFSPVFPTGFPTLYFGLNRVTEFVRRHETAIANFLREVAGRQEWGLKITTELDNHEELVALALDLWPEWQAYPAGVRYLRVRQQRPALLSAARERAARAIAQIIDDLRPFVAAARPLPAAQQGTRHVESHALLLDPGETTNLRERLALLVAEARWPSLDFALTGPWPPYSFRPRLNGGGSPEHD